MWVVLPGIRRHGTAERGVPLPRHAHLDGVLRTSAADQMTWSRGLRILCRLTDQLCSPRRATGGRVAELRRADVPSTLQAELPAAGLGRRIALDIARGLHFLHTHRIVHPPPPPPSCRPLPGTPPARPSAAPGAAPRTPSAALDSRAQCQASCTCSIDCRGRVGGRVARTCRGRQARDSPVNDVGCCKGRRGEWGAGRGGRCIWT